MQSPVLFFDENNVLDVIKILRGDNDCADNCTHVASDLIEYFKTGIIPLVPSSTAPSKSEDFDVITTTDWIKKENGDKYLGMVKSTVCLDNTSIMNIPCNILSTQLSDGTIDADAELLDVDNFTQYRSSIMDINNCLKMKAKENGTSFGFICIGRCGEHIDVAGHMLVYFATEEIVYYVDGQLYNGMDKIDNGCIFSDLTDRFEFADEHDINIDVFGEYVFYIPIGPIINDTELVEVKLESIDNVTNKKKVYQKQKCEHGRRKGSRICEHNRQGHLCKDCKGSGICEHNKQRHICKDCKGVSVCEHNRTRSYCIECKGGSVCEHNKLRSQCKECKNTSMCRHGILKSTCKDCKSASICEHNRQKATCKKCKGNAVCEHGRVKYVCIDCKGSGICEHNCVKSKCIECKDGSICEHNNIRSVCKKCKGGSICEHDNIRTRCKECKLLQLIPEGKVSSICEHNAVKYICVECKGASICKHNCVKSTCKQCRGNSICEHNRVKYSCKDCDGNFICKHNVRKTECTQCKNKRKYTVKKERKPITICKHNQLKTKCQECKSASRCEHGRSKYHCKDCKTLKLEGNSIKKRKQKDDSTSPITKKLKTSK